MIVAKKGVLLHWLSPSSPYSTSTCFPFLLMTPRMIPLRSVLLCSLVLTTGVCSATEDELVAAKIGMLFKLSTAAGNPISPFWARVATCGILAVSHINTRNMKLVPGVQLRDNFNVTYELHDTHASPSVAVARTFEMMASGSNPAPVHAIIGPVLSASAGPVSLMSAIEDIPVVGYASTAPALSQDSMYKWFNRVIPSDSQLVHAILKTCQQMKWDAVSVLYQDDLWGSGIAEAALEAAGKLNIHVATAQRFSLADSASIQNAVGVAQKFGTRVYVFAVLEEYLDELLFAAEDAGIAGPGFVWVNTGGINDPGGAIAKSSDPERLQRLATGVLDVRIEAVTESAEAFSAVLRETRAEDVYDPVLGDMEELVQILQAPVDNLCGYVYDATWAAALALSRVAWSEGKPARGDEVLRELRRLDFRGTTGRVLMDPETGDRQSEGVHMVVKNWQPVAGAAGGGGAQVQAVQVGGFASVGELQRWSEPVWAGGVRGWDAPMDGRCAPGAAFRAASAACEECAPGHHSAQGLACEACPRGTFAARAGMAGCDKCPRTAYGNASGLAACFACPANHEIALEVDSGTAPEHCECASSRVFQCGWGVTEGVLLAAAAAAAAVVVALSLRRTRADALWSIRLRDLHFPDPPEVLGSGTFGVVVAAEYRKTKVAVKRVIQARDAGSGGSSTRSERHTGRRRRVLSLLQQPSDADLGGLFSKAPLDPRAAATVAGGVAGAHDSGTLQPGRRRTPASVAATPDAAGYAGYASGEGGMSAGGRWRGGRAASGMQSVSPLAGVLDRMAVRSEHARQRRAFVEEMRVLSRLRHPCITTVMGAVVEHSCEPMLIMEFMEHGSLFDMIHNPTVRLSGELVIPILRHVASGLTFLHHWHTPMVHGDIKSANVLVDSQFRGKVADFGLSAKSSEACGTPLWMAPEVLRGAPNTPASDIYAFGITLWEVYARAEPYADEDPREVLRAVAGGAAGEEGEAGEEGREGEAGEEGREEKRPVVPAGCAAEVVAIMRQCWHREASLRPAGEEVLRMLQILDVNTMGPERAPAAVPMAAGEAPEHSKSFGRAGRSVLQDMFPKHVAGAILRGEEVPEDKRECATVLFSDIVGFTSLSATLASHQVSDMLHRLFTKLDALAEAHGVYKLETIGDCYIAVTNLVEKQDDDHAIRMAKFALGLIAACRATRVCEARPELGHVGMRCGFDTGPLVGAIVGTRHKKYTIFGNTVNTASRMESTSAVGQIQCTEEAAATIRKQLGEEGGLRLVERGQVAIKGKGSMATFFVEEDPGAAFAGFGRGESQPSVSAVVPVPETPGPAELGGGSGALECAAEAEVEVSMAS